MNIQKILFSPTVENKLSHDLSLLALRVFTGLAMAFGHGLGKIPPSEKFVEGIIELGFPMPDFFGWAAGLSEFAGGILLAVGLFTRPAAALVVITMGVAAFGRHSSDPFKMKELALLYMMIGIVFAIRGASRFSLDSLISKKF